MARLFSSTFEPRTLLGNRAQSPYHEINDKSLFPPRAQTVALGSTDRRKTTSSAVVEETTRQMRKEGRKLSKRLKGALGEERGIFYDEVQVRILRVEERGDLGSRSTIAFTWGNRNMLTFSVAPLHRYSLSIGPRRKRLGQSLRSL